MSYTKNNCSYFRNTEAVEQEEKEIKVTFMVKIKYYNRADNKLESGSSHISYFELNHDKGT